MILNDARGWAKATLPTYQDRKEFFEGIVNGDPDPVELVRDGPRARGPGADRGREGRARARGSRHLMPPLGIYAICFGVMLVLSIGVYINRYYATRKCHQCGAKVELGRSKCHACAYRFVN